VFLDCDIANICQDQLYKVAFYDGGFLGSKNNAQLWLFLRTQAVKNTYALVDFLNRRFMAINHWTKTAYSLPLTSCYNLTQYTISKQGYNTWIITTEIAHSTYILSSSLSFNPIFTSIDVYIPNFNQKCAITLAASNKTSIKITIYYN